jgi:hypothetical protein
MIKPQPSLLLELLQVPKLLEPLLLEFQYLVSDEDGLSALGA